MATNNPMVNKNWAIYEPALIGFCNAALVREQNPADQQSQETPTAGIKTDRLAGSAYGMRVSDDGRLGIIAINDALTNDDWDWFGIPYKRLGAMVEMLEEHETVEAIVLDINSPGGQVDGLFEFVSTLKNCVKPLYAYCEGLCASAAFALSTAATKIYATPSTQIGSVGVMTVITDWSKYMKNLGVEQTVMRSEHAKKKNLDPTSDEGKAEIQKALNEVERMLIEEIANNRGVTAEDVIAKFGQGLLFFSEQAKGLGMIDEIVPDFDAFVEKIMPSQEEGGGESMEITIDLLKAEHPEVASALVNEGRKAGLAEGAVAERARIAALKELADLDCAESVVREAISSGKSVSEAQSAIVAAQLEAKKSGKTNKRELDAIVGESELNAVNVAEVQLGAEADVQADVAKIIGVIEKAAPKKA